MAGIQDFLASLLTGQGPSPMAMGGGIDAAQDFGLEPEAPTMMRPEDLIVSPDPSKPRTAEQRQEGIRRMLTDFTFSLGTGLSAASANPRGRAQRTQAGVGATLQVPEFLRRAQEAEKVQEEQRKRSVVQLILEKQKNDTAAANQRSLEQSRINQDQNADATNARLTTQAAELNALKQAELDRKRIADEAAAAEKAKPKKLDEFNGVDANGKPIRIVTMQYPDGTIKYEKGPEVRETPKATKLLTPEEEEQRIRIAKANNVQRDQVVQVEGENGSSSFAIINKNTNEIRPVAAVDGVSDTPKLSDARLKTQANAKSGLRAIDKLRAELKKPNALKELAVPGSPTARTARAARNEMTDVLTRIRTGAALNKSEEAFYADQAPGLIDDLFSDPASIEYKLSIFEDNFKALSGEKSKPAVIEQISPSTKQYRYSTDGGKTWIAGRAPQ